ncbi:hypothetical protein ACFQ4C_18140 [Larkinella insperata]|uniref:Uncharacterized protein n=1 Tax=Larkinella insperata TaxID=332158 RepID=A0ABW3QKE3_9BACT|nr:hypothetical protein [Larkinella insperata]
MKHVFILLFISIPFLSAAQCKLTTTKDPFTKVETKLGYVDNRMVHIVSLATSSKGDTTLSVAFLGNASYVADTASRVMVLLSDETVMELPNRTYYQTANGPLAVNGILKTDQLKKLVSTPIKQIRLTGVEMNAAKMVNGYDIDIHATKYKKLQEIAGCFFK